MNRTSLWVNVTVAAPAIRKLIWRKLSLSWHWEDLNLPIVTSKPARHMDVTVPGIKALLYFVEHGCLMLNLAAVYMAGDREMILGG